MRRAVDDVKLNGVWTIQYDTYTSEPEDLAEALIEPEFDW